ncbi:hypothetical protein TNCV_1825261 [Trichonephila clavipes]|nr:hypothetical protein TNCV_1825261 [Trichonephila clavipes]
MRVNVLMFSYHPVMTECSLGIMNPNVPHTNILHTIIQQPSYVQSPMDSSTKVSNGNRRLLFLTFVLFNPLTG